VNVRSGFGFLNRLLVAVWRSRKFDRDCLGVYITSLSLVQSLADHGKRRPARYGWARGYGLLLVLVTLLLARLRRGPD